MSFNAGTILGYLKLDQSGFTGSMLKAEGITQMLGATISSFLANPLLGVANAAKEAVSYVAELTMKIADQGEHFLKLSQKTGASVEWLSAMSYAAQMADVSIDDVSQSMQILIKNMDDLRGGKVAIAAFQELGIAITDSKGQMRSAQDVFVDATEKIYRVNNATQRAAYAMDIFGRSGANMLPLMTQGKAGLEAMRAEAQRLGLVMTEQGAESAERFNDSIKRLKASFMGMAQTTLVPMFTDLAKEIDHLTPMAMELAPTFREFGKTLVDCAPMIQLFNASIENTLRICQGLAYLPTQVLKVIGVGGRSVSGGDGAPTVNVTVSPEDSARRVADKIAPVVSKNVKAIQHDLEIGGRRRQESDRYSDSLALR